MSNLDQSEQEQNPIGEIESVERIGELFPTLEILEKIGKGGMGDVYKVRQPRIDRVAALKILRHSSKESGGDFAKRFEREAQVLGQLNHPNIVTIYDFGDVAIPDGEDESPDNRLFYFLMEYVDGPDLKKLIARQRMPFETALEVIPQICDALQFAHNKGITHRDIKPANLLLASDGTIKIADFGLAKLVRGDTTSEDPISVKKELTMTGMTMGTPNYMAPEQWDNPAEVDHRADIYALGVVLFELLTGVKPVGFQSTLPSEIKMDSRFSFIVKRAVEIDVNARYQHASELKDDITQISEEETATDEVADKHPVKTSPKRRLAVTIAILFGILGLAFLGEKLNPLIQTWIGSGWYAVAHVAEPKDRHLALKWGGELQSYLSNGKYPHKVSIRETTNQRWAVIVGNELKYDEAGMLVDLMQSEGWAPTPFRLNGDKLVEVDQ